jgi:hypothetical protein
MHLNGAGAWQGPDPGPFRRQGLGLDLGNRDQIRMGTKQAVK